MAPHHPLRNPLPDAHLPKPPSAQRPDQAHAHTRKQRRRRNEERHAAADSSAPDCGEDGADERVFRVPHDPPEDEDADVVQGAQQGARAEPGRRVSSGGGVVEE